MLEKIKLALRIKTTAFDSELEDLIEAGLTDLKFGGAKEEVLNLNADPAVTQALITYCKMNFGTPDDYDRLKRSYDEQKAQLGTATGYTDWGESHV